MSELIENSIIITILIIIIIINVVLLTLRLITSEEDTNEQTFCDPTCGDCPQGEICKCDTVNGTCECTCGSFSQSAQQIYEVLANWEVNTINLSSTTT